MATVRPRRELAMPEENNNKNAVSLRHADLGMHAKIAVIQLLGMLDATVNIYA